MFLSLLLYCTRTLTQVKMDIAKTTSTQMVGNMKEVFLEQVSSEEEHKGGE